MATKEYERHINYQAILGLATILPIVVAIVTHINSNAQGCGIPILGYYTPVEFAIVTSAAVVASVLGLCALFLPREKQKMILFQSVLVVFGIGLGMVLAETYLRLREPKSMTESVYVSNDIIGRMYRPNSTVGRLSVDSRGFLIHQPDHGVPPQGARRVLMLGDSFVAGIEVAGEDNMSVVLESALNSDLSPQKYHVLNLGVAGIEPARYRIIFREFGLDYQPDYVVVVVFVLNDFFEDARLYDEGRIEYDESGDVARILPEIDEENYTFWTAETGFQHIIVQENTDFFDIRLARFIREKLLLPFCTARQEQGRETGDIARKPTYADDFRQRDAMAVDSMLVGIYKDTYSSGDMAHINRTLSYLTHIQEDAAAIGAETIIVILPPREQINLQNPDEPADLPSTQPQDLLKDFCEERGMICVDLLPALKEAAREQLPYLPGNIHFNEYGHRIAAEEIEKAIIKLETMPKVP